MNPFSARPRYFQLVVGVGRFVVDVDGVVLVVDVDDVVLEVDVDDVVLEVDVDPDVDEVVVADGVAGETVVGVCELVPDDIIEVVGAVPVSAETQPEGGVESPPWPGIKTVPAHPKSEKWASSVTVPPSEKVTVDVDSRMNPAASTEMRSRIV